MIETYKGMAQWLSDAMGIIREPETIRAWKHRDGLPVQQFNGRDRISADALRAFVLSRNITL